MSVACPAKRRVREHENIGLRGASCDNGATDAAVLVSELAAGVDNFGFLWTKLIHSKRQM